jgi:hypothetical protein
MFNYLKEQTDNQEILTILNQWDEYSKNLPITNEEIVQGRKDLLKLFQV